MASSHPSKEKDWSATQYLLFNNQRTRPVYDLVAQIAHPSAPEKPLRIVDLGCGPGNSTAVLASRFPHAHITGMDSSPAMLVKARQSLPDVEFVEGDLQTYAPGPGVNILFSNAVFHWLRRSQRIPTAIRLLRSQSSGGVFAFQIPDNYDEPSHRAMRDVAAQPGKPWSDFFPANLAASDEERPDLDPVETPAEWYDALIAHCASVDVWHTLYEHVLDSPRDVVEWVMGTGLQPFVNRLPEGSVREAYVQAYEERVAQLYPRLKDGKVMLRYPRLFVVAVRK